MPLIVLSECLRGDTSSTSRLGLRGKRKLLKPFFIDLKILLPPERGEDLAGCNSATCAMIQV